MRKIDKVVIHCSATREGQDVSVDTVRQWHLNKGWQDIGYHFYVALDGTVHTGRDIEVSGAHTLGENENSIGVCYAGGVEEDGKTPKDTRTKEQENSLVNLLTFLKQDFKISFRTQQIFNKTVNHRPVKEYRNYVGLIVKNMKFSSTLYIENTIHQTSLNYEN